MTEKNLQIIHWLLSSEKPDEPTSGPDFSVFKQAFFKAATSWEIPMDRAIAGGFTAGCPAYAFAAGYCSALQHLVPALSADTFACFCITEEGGGHPRAIQSQLVLKKTADDHEKTFTLSGKKKFVTCAKEADLFLVAASTGTGEDGKNRIRMVRIDSRSPGISILPMKGLNLVPEISHGEITFSDVVLNETDILRGDGYIDYIKPFRTIEDLQVSAAILGYVFKNACRYEWDEEIREKILGRIISLRALALESPDAPAVHILLGDALTRIKELIEELDPFWEKAEQDVKAAWDRDKILMNIADKARAKRLQTAREFYRERRP